MEYSLFMIKPCAYQKKEEILEILEGNLKVLFTKDIILDKAFLSKLYRSEKNEVYKKINENYLNGKKAGITRINVSLDTMQNEKFKSIVGVDCLENVLKGIEKILNISDCLVKINMVVMKDNISEIQEFVRYAIKQNKKYGSERVIIRFLQFFPCNPNQLEKDGQKFWVDEYITETNILNQIKEIGEIQEIEKNKIQGDNPSMKYYRVNNEVTVGNLSMFSWGYPCGNCHKLRISPQGNATICLNDEKTEKLIGTTFEEKKKIIKNMLERRENEVNKNVNRKHFRNNLGEFRFGKNEKEANIEDFYEMLRKGRGRECNI